MKKALCIVLCCVFAVAFVAVPVFATSVPETTAAPNVFGTLFDLGSSGYTATSSSYSSVQDFLQYNGYTGGSSKLVCSGSFTVNGSSTPFVGLCAYGAPIYYFPDGASDGSPLPSSGFQSISITVSDVNPSWNLYGLSFVAGSASGLVPEFADEVFSVGGGLISFVMSNWIVLIPVVAFLVILCIGVIRKTVKGA